MFSNIGEKTLYVFGIANFISIPMVYMLYPESNQRTLEQIDLLFAAKTPWVWDAERNFQALVEANPALTQAARVHQQPGDVEVKVMEHGEKAASEHVSG